MIIIFDGNGKPISRVLPGRQLTGEQIPGDLNSWETFSTDPNSVLAYSYDQLSQRSTTLFHTHAPIKAAINAHTNYAIGPGLVFRSQPDWELLGVDREEAREWGKRFQKWVHYISLLLNFYEKQSILFRSSMILGDSLLLFDYSPSDTGLPFDLIEVGGDQINYQEPGTTLGIYADSLLRKSALSLNGKKVDFIDPVTGKRQVSQLYNKMMARQLRGYPLAYTIIHNAKNNERWKESVLARAVIETLIIGTSTGPAGGVEELNRNIQRLAEMQRESSGGATPGAGVEATSTQDIAAGSFISFKDGRDMKFTTIQTPSSNMSAFEDIYIDTVGMATNTPPEVVRSRYSTSYTAHKGALNDFKRAYLDFREQAVRAINRPVIKAIADYIFESGIMEPLVPTYRDNPIVGLAMLQGNFLGPVPGHINPAQEIAAKVTAVEEGFMLRGDVALEYGNDYDSMLEEWQRIEREFRRDVATTNTEDNGSTV